MGNIFLVIVLAAVNFFLTVGARTLGEALHFVVVLDCSSLVPSLASHTYFFTKRGRGKIHWRQWPAFYVENECNQSSTPTL